MAHPRYSIGIDLGTSNSALAFAPLGAESRPRPLAIPQWDGPTQAVEADTLPSALYRPEAAAAAPWSGAEGGAWIAGRLARRKAGETPGRVVTSAKSWLCHHAADRTQPFLPWGADDLAPDERISPVGAAALVLGHLRAAWDRTVAVADPAARFDAQDVTVTVPASFDAVAQRLTLDAARRAGFPEGTRLLEEPQAAFLTWLDAHEAGALGAALPGWDGGPRHVAVIDVGGGTTDFSLFALSGDVTDPEISRIAVSDHILLGGDNVDLALAHLLEPRLTQGVVSLSGGQWDHLVAVCRALKERVLGSDGAPGESFPASIPGRGSGLMAAALSATVTRAEVDALLFDGFFPECEAGSRPARASGALKEWGLPYAADGAVSRHLAAFLSGRPPVDAVLFNGGSLAPAGLRRRLLDLIGRWQGGPPPAELANDRLDLAVALGAASHGRRLVHGRGRIEAGAARAVFLEAHDGDGAAALVCLLPHGAPPDRTFDLSGLGLSLRLNRPVRFRLFTSTRHESARAGDVVAADPDTLHGLPPLETTAQAEGADPEAVIAVAVTARTTELGLLQVSCRSLDPALPLVWPLDFDLRPGAAGAPAAARAPTDPGVPPAVLEQALARLAEPFSRPPRKGEKIAAPKILQALETILGQPRGRWPAPLLRALWPALEAVEGGRAFSAEHEEAWVSLAGFVLRPGFGVAHDAARIESVWRIHAAGLRFPGKRLRVQEHLVWRRLAGGLTRERQETLLGRERDRLAGKNATPELVRMLGAFERLGPEAKTDLVRRLLDEATQLMDQRKHCAPHLAALGGLLNRTPLYCGPEGVVAPALVEQVFDALKGYDWAEPDFAEAQALFLRAARAVEDRRIDLPLSLRQKIAIRLEKCGVSAGRTRRLREVVPVERDEVLGQWGDDLPPGLILSETPQ